MGGHGPSLALPEGADLHRDELVGRAPDIAVPEGLLHRLSHREGIVQNRTAGGSSALVDARSTASPTATLSGWQVTPSGS
ncbi:MAG: hypothetical protein ACT4PO_13365 [Actinomycetota bacterium]